MKYDELRLEYNRPLFKKKLQEKLGDKCCNCGSDIDVEYHHIVPLFVGGTNNLANIVPLCHKCHVATHNYLNLRKSKSKRSDNNGRPQRIKYADAKPVLDDYIHGRIGTSECKKRLGYGQGTHLGNRKVVKEYLSRNNIVSYRNNIDVVATNGNLSHGREVGYIKYSNGQEETIRYMAI